jgi:hypothetical protein
MMDKFSPSGASELWSGKERQTKRKYIFLPLLAKIQVSHELKKVY